MKDKNPARRETTMQVRQRLINHLVSVKGKNAQTREYIVEAEHQDGYAYWLQFANEAEVIADYELYWREHD